MRGEANDAARVTGGRYGPAIAADDSTDEGLSSDGDIPEEAVVSESVREGKERPREMGYTNL